MDFAFIFYSDLMSLISGIKSDHLVYPLCFVAWIFMVFLSLATIDRRDFVTFLTYTLSLFCIAAILFIILPNLALGHQIDFVRQALLLIISILIITSRWLIAPDGLKALKPIYHRKKTFNE